MSPVRVVFSLRVESWSARRHCCVIWTAGRHPSGQRLPARPGVAGGTRGVRSRAVSLAHPSPDWDARRAVTHSWGRGGTNCRATKPPASNGAMRKPSGARSAGLGRSRERGAPRPSHGSRGTMGDRDQRAIGDGGCGTRAPQHPAGHTTGDARSGAVCQTRSRSVSLEASAGSRHQCVGGRRRQRVGSLAARRARVLGVGLLSGGYGQDELERAEAYRVYEDPSDFLRHLDGVGVCTEK